MNTPNKLTILRILLVPLFVAALLLAVIPHHFLIAGLIFGVASLTDLLDGKLARKRDQITDFGKFADPLADKILVISALICFVQLGIIGAVPVIVLLFREYAVTSIRLVAASNGKVVAANLWGKAKTVSQIIAVVCVFILQYILELADMGAFSISPAVKTAFSVTTDVLVWISVLLAVLSGVIYLYDNRTCISGKK